MSERGRVSTANRPQQGKTHLWIVLTTVLALGALSAVGLTHQARAEATPAVSTATTTPAFSVAGGYYDQDILLQISAPHPSARVFYTLDGSVPTQTNGSLYARPIHLSASMPAVTVVRARAVWPDDSLGPMVSASYLVGVEAALPMVSLIVAPDDLWDTEHGIYANPQERGVEWERPVDVSFVDQDRRLGFQVSAGLRIHGHGTRDFAKKAFRLYFRQEYGLSRLAYPLFPGSQIDTFKRLVLHNSGQDRPVFPHINWTHLRNPLATELVFQLGGLATRSRPVLLFINGELWGIYQVRERLDRFFLADHYGVEEADFLEAPDVPGQSEIIMGDRSEWDRLLQYLETHDLADPASYAYVESQVDLDNFLDYNLLQIYTANDDWPHQNVHQFRPYVQGGRWQWMFWDNDRGFAAEPVGRIDANIIAPLLEHNNEYTRGRDVLLVRKLLGNPAFLERFLLRTTDLLNTVLSPSSVIEQIDALAAELEPDIAYEASRWSVTSNWASSVEVLRGFARQRPDIVRQHMIGSFGLAGTATLTFEPPSSGRGSVAINGTMPGRLPWEGVYFLGIPIEVVAVPAPGYRFVGWGPADLPQASAITWMVDGDRTFSPRFQRIDADEPQPGDVILTGHSMGMGSHLADNWIELQVVRRGGVDLRGWRVTDNDTKTATDEGSLILSDHPAYAHVPRGTVIRIIVGRGMGGRPPQDDLDTWDRRMTMYVGNGNLDTSLDPGFNLGHRDNLVLLAPGPTEAFDDDRGIAFLANSAAVTPATFGILADGVVRPDKD